MAQTKYQREWYIRNRKRILKRRKKYRKENKLKIKEYQKNYTPPNPERGVHRMVIERCYNPDSDSYESYGLEGIKVCARWRSNPNGYDNFIADMGKRPSPYHELHRKDSDYPYIDWNCEWLHKRDHELITCGAKFIEYNGLRLCYADWERRLGFSKGTIVQRKMRGFTDEECINIPLGIWKSQYYRKLPN